MDPFTLAMIGGSLLSSMNKGQQADRQNAIDVTDAKWGNIGRKTDVKAADQAPWINDLMATGSILHGKSIEQDNNLLKIMNGKKSMDSQLNPITSDGSYAWEKAGRTA